MRTIIVLDEKLVNDAIKLSHAQTKSEAVDLALQHFVAYLKQQNMKSLFGKIKWEGDLNKQRINS